MWKNAANLCICLSWETPTYFLLLLANFKVLSKALIGFLTVSSFYK